MDLQKTITAYNHALGLLFFDGATSAPRGTAANRGQTMSVLSQALYRLNTRPDTVELLAFLDENRSGLNEREQRMVDLLRKEGRKMERIPAEEYMAFRRLSVEANAVWRTAKEHSDFALFAPYLQKRFDMSRQIAAACTGPVRLETFPGAGHGVSYLSDPERYGRVVLDFLHDIVAAP
jgi:carboxypeptidase Taq